MLPSHSRAYLCFDPRDHTQDLDDRATWKPADNAILISATMLFASQGENCRICWEKVAALADLCDATEGSAAAEATPHLAATREETDRMLRTVLQRRERT
ncbi:hypothetical protein [Hyphomicrobium sp.]|uniref:hypothetical protein n=1 Tax=Hyphomicrobium sp. TaxID=82 RepID=UPI002E34C4CA|nr:hypothetical protein [Hyphomicrobium sp.]HEX2842559.1 hypothetical protein [Hyphomicrobium sp.]